MTLKRDDWDAWHKVSEELAVVRWGRDWFVLDTTTNAQLGPPWPRMIDARDHALQRVERGDYK